MQRSDLFLSLLAFILLLAGATPLPAFIPTISATNYNATSSNQSMRMFRSPFTSLHYDPGLTERGEPDWSGLLPLCPELQPANAIAAFGDPTITDLGPYRTTFNGYFQPEMEPDVLFAFVSNFKQPSSKPTTADLVTTIGSPLLDQVQTYYEQAPPEPSQCVPNRWAGLVQDRRWTTPPNTGAALILCPMLFEGQPQPQPNAQGQHKMPDLRARGCAFATDATTNTPMAGHWTMSSFASILLHEFLHWNGLCEKEYPVFIRDWNSKNYPNQVPVSGYGPYEAWSVNRAYAAGTKPVAPNPEAPNLLHNDDNYVFFALEIWFMEQCRIAAFAAPVPETI